MSTPPASPEARSFPAQIGRYQTQSVAGAGGFAVVLRAYDEALEDHVAIKVLAENWTADADIRERFLAEARLLRRLHNQHLVAVHDIGELPDGRPYFVMDYADRGTLDDRLTGAIPGVDQVSLEMLVGALAGSLTVVHDAGFVHRDVNPRNVLIKRTSRSAQARSAPTSVRAGLIGTDERLLLGDLGLAKDIATSGAASVIGGSPGFQAPEQGRSDAEITAAADIYGATATLWAAMTGTALPTDGVAETIEQVDEPWRSFFQQGLAEDPLRRHPSISHWADDARRALGSPGSSSVSVVSTPPAVTAVSPYQGLAAFQPEDADRFFGRGPLVEELVARLRRERTLVIAGASGSGKSSLMRAGLIPAISRGSLTGSERWPIVLFVPGTKPLSELEYQLTRAWRSTHPAASQPGDDSGSHRLRRLADEIADTAGGLLICIDQFEELFTHQGTREEQEEFLEALAGLVDPTDSQVRLVMAIRADFYSTASLFPWLARRITDNQLLVGPMSRVELREAIEAPAHQAGLVLDDGLADLILEEGGSEPGSLPLVSHALVETWKRRSGRRMTIEGYRQAGGVTRAIAKSAETVYLQRFDDEQRAVARRLFLRLVNPGEGTPDTRRSLAISDLESGSDPDMVRHVAETLTDARLLTVSESNLQLAHEALIQTWPRFRTWIDESREDLRFRQRIGRAASEWDDGDRDPDLLYRGTPLETALEWADGRRDDLTELELDFLDSSDRVEKEHQRHAAEEAARIRRLRRLGVGALAVLAVAALIASIVAFTAFRSARNNEQVATERLSGSLGTQSAVLASSHPRLALALAVEALATGMGSSPEARAGLIDASQTLAMSEWVPASSSRVVGDGNAIGVSPDGSFVVTGNRNGTIQVWNSRDLSAMTDPVQGHTKAIERVVFSPDGSQMFTAGQDRIVLRWDMADPTDIPPPVVAAEVDDIVWGLDVAPDGSTLAVASEDGTVTLWDGSTASRLGEPLIEFGFDFLTATFSPDGSMVLAGTGQGEVFGWSLPDRELVIGPFPAHGSDVWEIQFTPDGSGFATRSSDGRVRIWSTTSQELRAEPFGAMTPDARGIAFTPDGSFLLAGAHNGRMLMAEATAMAAVTQSEVGHTELVTDAAIAADGSVFATLGFDQTVRLWRPGLDPSSVRHDGLSSGGFGLAVHPTGDRLAVGDGDGRVQILDATDLTSIATIDLGTSPVWSLAYNEDGSLLAAGADNGDITVLDADGEVVAGPWAGHEARIHAMVFLDDETLLTGCEDGFARQWDARTGEPAGPELSPIRGALTGAAVSPAGRLVALSDFSGAVSIWDWSSGRRQGDIIQADDNALLDVAWSPDGERLTVASADEIVVVLDADTGEALGELTPHGDLATSVAFVSNDILISASGEGELRVWDIDLLVQTGQPLHGHNGSVWEVAALDDGRFVSVGEDGSVVVWDGLNLDRACAKAGDVWGDLEIRTYLGADTAPAGCVP